MPVNIFNQLKNLEEFTAGDSVDLLSETISKKKNKDFISSYLELAELSSNLENIIDIISEINNSSSELDFLVFLLNKALNLIPEADYGRIYLNDLKGGYFLKTVYRKNMCLKAEINIKNDLSLYKSKNSDDIIFSTDNNQKNLLIELKAAENFIGAVILYIADNNKQKFNQSSKRLAYSLEKLSSSYLTNNRYTKLQEKFTDEIIFSLTKLLEIHDIYTKDHNQNVANISKKIAGRLNLNKKQIKQCYWTGILHDIGKIIIPAKILNKKDELTKKEFELVKKHPEWGYKTLKSSEELKEIAIYVLYHHEYWDGSGYPEGLLGKEIPLISRIVALADAWDAMCSDRSYRSALSKEKAKKEIIKNKGKQFSPELVNAFLKELNNI